MKKAFTLIELLVVIAIIAILAAMLMPALEKARTRARQATCRSNVHELGLSLAMFRNDFNQQYRLGSCTFVDGSCQVVAFLMADGYVGDRELLVCPNLDTPYSREPDLNWHSGYMICGYPYGSWASQKWVGPREFAYFYDEDRIAATAPPTRVIMADGIEMATSFGVEPPNHFDGANLLFVDGAVQWQNKEYADERWEKTEAGGGWGQPSLDMDHKISVDFMVWMGDQTPWVRYGVIPNPRLNEDPRDGDLDDIYEVEGRHGPDGYDPEYDQGPTIAGGQKDVTFTSYNPPGRCGAEDFSGKVSEIDASLGGGSYVAAWANWGFDAAWRGCNAGNDWNTANDHAPNNPSIGPPSFLAGWGAGEGDGWQGWTWGVPEPWEDRIYP